MVKKFIQMMTRGAVVKPAQLDVRNRSGGAMTGRERAYPRSDRGSSAARPRAETEPPSSAQRPSFRLGDVRVLPKLAGGATGPLAVGRSDDPRELEADRVAESVVRAMPAGPLSPTPPLVQRACAGCTRDEEEVQRKAVAPAPDTAGAEVAARISSMQGGGSPLGSEARALMEPRLGHDLSRVRIHTGVEAAATARALRARAFTVRNDIFFSANAYDDRSAEGRRLLAHELAHVVQQRGLPSGQPQLFAQRRATRGAGGCGPLTEIDEDNSGARGAGLAAHIQIQDFLLQSGVDNELGVPRATKDRIDDMGCQPEGVAEGRADLWSSGAPVELAEIKPIGAAKSIGVRDVEHYIRRARQSMDRAHRDGPCGAEPRSAADGRFAREVGGDTARVDFKELTGVLVEDTLIGRFDGDRSRNLKARLVEPGAVGYWCTGGGADTFVCNVSQREMEEYIDRALVPAQDVLDRFLDEHVARRLDRVIERMDLAAVFHAAGRLFGDELRQLVGPELGSVLDLLPSGSSLEDIGRFLEMQSGPAMRTVLRTLARRLKSLLLNELRVRLRDALRQILQDLLVELCVGVPAVALATLLDRLTERLRQAARQLAPAVVAAAMATFAGQLLMELQQMLAQMLEGLGRALQFVFGVALRILATLAVALIVIGAVVMAVLGFVAIFDPVPGDEVALGAGAAALASMIPVLIRFIRTGTTEAPSPGGS